MTARSPEPGLAATPRRVVVTGMGMLTALGNDVASTWEGMVAGRSGHRPDRVLRPVAAPGPDRRRGQGLRCVERPRQEGHAPDGPLHPVRARRRAAGDGPGRACPARLEGEEAERTGVILGTGLGGVGTLVDGITINALRGPDRISPFFIPMGIPNVGAGQVAISFGMTGPNFTTVSACATGGHAIGEAWETIRRGDAETMIAGGAEAGDLRAARRRLRLDARPVAPERRSRRRASRPFDQGRDGFVPGRGLRRPSSSRSWSTPGPAARRSSPSSIGYGATADASHITLPAPGGIGAVQAARRALAKAGLEAGDIDHVNAHATSTPEGDKAELQAIQTILGDARRSVSITANKSMIGHTLGAAGAIEAIITILTIREELRPADDQPRGPRPGEAEGLDLTPNGARQATTSAIALSNSFGFGGQNTALIFRRWAE